MEVKVHYDGLADRKIKEEQYEAQKKPRDFDIPGFARDTKLRMTEDRFDDPNWKHGDPIVGTMTFTDEAAPSAPKLPPLCTHWASIDSFNPDEVKPMRVGRIWEGKEYSVDCYVTETIKDQYLAGDIVAGDFVLVEFLEDSADRAIVFAKVLKTW